MVEDTEFSTEGGRVDRFGMFASSICAVHCAVCALVPAAFVTLGLDVLLDHRFEWTLTLLAVVAGLVAMVMGWRKHRKLRVLITLAVGIIGLLAVRLSAGHAHHDDHSDHADHGAHSTHINHAAGSVNHDDHGDKAHHGDQAKEAHNDKPHHEGLVTQSNAGEHEHHEHGSGEGLGIFAGLILLMGHVTNLQEMRRRREGADGLDDCCDESIQG